MWCTCDKPYFVFCPLNKNVTHILISVSGSSYSLQKEKIHPAIAELLPPSMSWCLTQTLCLPAKMHSIFTSYSPDRCNGVCIICVCARVFFFFLRITAWWRQTSTKHFYSYIFLVLNFTSCLAVLWNALTLKETWCCWTMCANQINCVCVVYTVLQVLFFLTLLKIFNEKDMETPSQGSQTAVRQRPKIWCKTDKEDQWYQLKLKQFFFFTWQNLKTELLHPHLTSTKARKVLKF